MSDILPGLIIDNVAKTATFSYSSLLTANGGSLDTDPPNENQLLRAILGLLHTNSATWRDDDTKLIQTNSTTDLDRIAIAYKNNVPLTRRQVLIDLFEAATAGNFDPDVQ